MSSLIGTLRTLWQSYPPGVVVFTLIYLLAASAGAVLMGNREFLFYIIILLVLIAVVSAVHLRVGLSPGVLWGLAVWGVAHMAGGLVPVPASWPIDGSIRVLYSWWIIPEYLKFDHVVHIYGFGAATFLCWEGFQAAAKHQDAPDLKPTLGIVFLCASASMGLGAFNEVVEFAATLLFPETNVGGYVNTGWDLVSNMAGAAMASILIFALERRPR